MLAPRPLTLTGRRVELQPFVPEHAAGLFEAAQDDEVWTFIPWPKPRSLADMEAFIDATRGRMAAGSEVAFAIIERQGGKAVGQISYFDSPRNTAISRSAPGWRGKSGAVASTPSASTCCCGTLLKRWTVSGCK